MGLFFTGLSALLLLAAAVSDLRSRTISNRLNLAIGSLAIPLWWVANFSLWPDVAFQLLAAVGIFLIFLAIYAIGAMGGGDVKMIAAISLWIPVSLLLPALMVMAIAGGLLSLVMLIRSKWASESHQIQVPYGVAVAVAGLWVLYEHYFNLFRSNALG